jgi:hypothetical protein
MKTIFLLLAVVFVGCEKDCESNCGELVGYIRVGTYPNWEYSYVVRDECQELTEVPSSVEIPYNSTVIGQTICF